jgi:TolB-like protein/DNA-binding winged helix-turn-helix (wHTH) protein
MSVSPPCYRFADLTLDVGQRRLSRGDETIALSKLTFALLRVLVEAAPNVVTHTELAEKVWGPRRVVTPENLAKRVMRLREALGDRADAPRYVEGLRGQGYRLIPAVESVASLAALPAAAQSGATSRSEATPVAGAVLATSAVPPSHSLPRRRLPALRIAFAASIALAMLLAFGAYVAPKMLGGPAEAGALVTRAPKIVVLPFANLSSDPERRHFADGLTDELIIGLQRLPGVKVTSRATSFALRDSQRGAKEIAADLGVQYVLEGSVGNDGERLRVRAQLSDAAGFSVLPYSYEGAADRVFDVQDEIVDAIAAALRAPLGLGQAVERAGTSHVEAYQLYLASKIECTQGNMTPEGFDRALRLIERALAIDPKFARAWMFKSQIHTMRAGFVAEGRAAEIAAAEEAATRSLGLAPEYGDGYNARGLIRGTYGDWPGAADDYERAQAHGASEFPHDVSFLLSSGRFAKARARIEQLLEVDPLNEDLFGFLAVVHEVLDEPDAADAAYRRGRLLYDPWEFGDVVGTWIRAGRDHVALHDVIAPRSPFANVAARAEQPGAAHTVLKQAAHDPRNQAPATLANLAILAAAAGEHTLALSMLSEAISGSKLLTYVAWLPAFDEVRRLPGFKGLLVDVGIVDYWRAAGWPDVCRPAGENDFDCI